jgi:hypothetical protein
MFGCCVSGRCGGGHGSYSQSGSIRRILLQMIKKCDAPANTWSVLANVRVEKYLERNHVDTVRALRSLVDDTRLGDTSPA